MTELNMIEFACPVCAEALEISSWSAGKQVRCLECHAPITVPQLSQPTRPGPAPQPAGDTVPVRMGLPKVGHLETQVSKKDASRMAFGFLGGIIALMGVIVAAMFGINLPKKS